MKTPPERLELIYQQEGYWAERIAAQLRYASGLRTDAGQNAAIEGAVDYLTAFLEDNCVITKPAALKAEEMMAPLSAEAKSYNVIAVAHAHLDMNWMWNYAETVSCTLDTLRTMLDMMNEYPDFKFSQSQASVYRIVEEYDPDMLEEIRQRVREGRWEVSASTWVEADKNMPGGESMARHVLYTKRYLSGLLGVDPDSLKLDFEPDTFGHSKNVPELLSKGGVRYYYHCRGAERDEKSAAYRWVSPSGESVIVYYDPQWYNASVTYFKTVHKVIAFGTDFATRLLEFCHAYNTDTMLKVYGVGNHGGGPTRSDIEKLIDMAAWPVFPSIRFGTYAEFFATLEKISDALPVFKGEMNPIFTGCYSAQARVKMANRISEAKLFDAEAFEAAGGRITAGSSPAGAIQEAWRKTLFSQFHDILTGSCVPEAKEYAMGTFQQVVATADAAQAKAMRRLAAKIDTSSLPDSVARQGEDVSEGGGVGYLGGPAGYATIPNYGLPQTERGRGKTRIIHLFNSSGQARKQPAEVSVWDWPGDIDRLEVTAHDGAAVRHQVICEAGKDDPQVEYWGHICLRLLIDAEIPAMGYSTYVITERAEGKPHQKVDNGRIEKNMPFVMENAHVRIEFDDKTAAIRSWVDKQSGQELIDPARPAGIFRLIEEDMPSLEGMSAWMTGRHMKVVDLHEEHGVAVRPVSIGDNLLRQSFRFEIKFRSSTLKTLLYLDYNSAQLVYDTVCDWHEHPAPADFVPQLNFAVPLAAKAAEYVYDIPFGTISRPPCNIDLPANSWVAAAAEDGSPSLSVITDSKYAYRGYDDTLAVTLIRSSFHPDRFPENGEQRFRIAVGPASPGGEAAVMKRAFDFTHPVGVVSGVKRGGELPLAMSLLELKSGSIEISAVKLPESGAADCMVMRFYEISGNDTQAVFEFPHDVKEAWYADVNENRLGAEGITVWGRVIKVSVKAFSVVTLGFRI